jgi:hypothetical protein
MLKAFQTQISNRNSRTLEYALIIVTALIPLFFNYPYRINLFLAWEGAFRMSQGEIPYRDFGSPVGYGFWILPAFFFKIFGAYVYTLLIVQAFINLVSGFAFRWLLKIFSLSSSARLLPLLVYCLSYSMFNFWPWYNHFVFVVELLGLCFLCNEILKPIGERSSIKLVVSAFFIAFSFLTKQDTGGLSFCVAVAILIFDFIYERKIKTPIFFIGGYVVSLALMIAPFLPYEFNYWFNMGQFPHNARVDKFDIINEFFGASEFIKIYLVLIFFILISRFNVTLGWQKEKKYFLLALVVIAILAQASIIQVTSYTPIDGNIYFHSFAFAFIVCHFSSQINFAKIFNLTLISFLICLWWSGVFWTRFLKERVQKFLVDPSASGKNVISKRTFLMGNDSTSTEGANSRSKWIVSTIPSFKRIKIPESTDNGMKQIMNMPESKKKDLKMLNMSELTPLAFDIGYVLEKGQQYPLWYHKGVAFFDREVNSFCDKIANKEYDIILFEDIPNVNQFYPYEVRDCMKQHYKFKFKFLAPRIPEISYVEVYTKE